MADPLDPAMDPLDSLATPEGDNEGLPGEPLSGDVPAPERPRGDEPRTSLPLRKALD